MIGPSEGSRLFPIIGAGSTLSKGVKHGVIQSEHECAECLTKAVSLAEKQSHLPFPPANIAIGGTTLSATKLSARLPFSNPDHEIRERDVTQCQLIAEREFSAKYKNKTILHSLPSHFSVDGETVVGGSPIGYQGGVLVGDYTIISCQDHVVDSVYAACDQAGIQIGALVAEPVAIAALTLSDQQREVGVGLLDIGADTTTFAVFESGTLVSLAVFPVGGNHMTSDLALVLRIPLTDAEQYKRGNIPEDGASRKKISDIVHARLGDVIELVERHLKSINRDGLLPGGVVVTGGASQIEDLPQVMRNNLKLPVSFAQIPDELLRARVPQTAIGAYASIAALGGGERTRTISLDVGEGIRSIGKSLKNTFKLFLDP
jgi:cell division protein FtsA